MEDLSQNLITTLRESLLVLDLDLRVKIANPSFYRTFKAEPADVVGRCLYELGSGTWDIPSLRAAFHEVVASGTPFEDFAIEHDLLHSGKKVMVLNASRVERTAGAEPLILLAMDDVTEQRQAAAIIQQYLQKLEASNRELQAFAYIASHDLQEPLRAIRAFSDRLQSKHAGSMDASGLDYLARIQKAAGRMSQLISDLLTYSRVTTQGNAFQPVSLAVLAQECVDDLSRRLEECRGSIEVGDLPTLEADPTQMRQLLQNLLENGLKFHRADEPPRVRITSHRVVPPEFAQSSDTLPPCPFCYITVQDHGIGFDEKYMDRIFSPFERLHNQNEYPGTGIGLAVCRRIVERHNGTLTAKSVLKEGSTFFVALPLSQTQDALTAQLS